MRVRSLISSPQKSRTVKLLKEVEERIEKEAPLRPEVHFNAIPGIALVDRSTDVQHELWRQLERKKEELRRKVREAELEDCTFKPKLNKVCDPAGRGDRVPIDGKIARDSGRCGVSLPHSPCLSCIP